MCEIFCFNSNKPKEVNECLKCFYNHSEDHPHGWGLANMHDDNFEITKEPVKASCSKHLKSILANPVIGNNIFAHIRLATIGEIISPNCHPFTKIDDNNRSWVLIHNGTIFDYPQLDEYKEIEKGDTDSERILLYLIDKVNEFESKKESKSNPIERFNLLKHLIDDLSFNNKLNLMIFDGEVMYIHSNMKNSLYYLKNEEGILIATTPVTDDKNWKPVEINKLFCLHDGEILLESKEHSNEYVETEEQLEYINKFIESLGEKNGENN